MRVGTTPLPMLQSSTSYLLHLYTPHPHLIARSLLLTRREYCEFEAHLSTHGGACVDFCGKSCNAAQHGCPSVYQLLRHPKSPKPKFVEGSITWHLTACITLAASASALSAQHVPHRNGANHVHTAWPVGFDHPTCSANNVLLA